LELTTSVNARRVLPLSPTPTMARLCAITPEKTLF
jgi:hypothetical protein